MRVFLFKPRFVDRLLDGTKASTIRGKPAKTHEIVSLRVWEGTAFRSKQKEIGRAKIGFVNPIHIHSTERGTGWIRFGLARLNGTEAAYVAEADGFDSSREFFEYFFKNHGPDFDGYHHYLKLIDPA